MKLVLSSKCLAALCCAVSLTFVACGDDAPGNAANKANASAVNTSSADKVSDANLDAEIARLEKHAERSPNDDAVREQLAKLYVRRGNNLKAANDLEGALKDYRRAIQYDPDNEEALENAAALTPQGTGEYGEPEPPPISPNVTTGGEEPTPTQQPTNRRQ
jgi:tetratricopeptide (TPR) repeat protein